ncbi:MAG: 30S ribosomal protein S17 [archaeon]
MKKTIGIETKPPEKECKDPLCPYHGTIGVHGRIFTGTVISDRMAKTVTVEWPRRTYIQKYERYQKKRSKVKAHNPECIHAKQGQKVKIMETRPLSKTKNFIVIEVLE